MIITILKRQFSSGNEVGVFKSTKKASKFELKFYDFLIAEPRSQKDASAFIFGEGDYEETSNDVKNMKSKYREIAKLASEIRDHVNRRSNEVGFSEPASSNIASRFYRFLVAEPRSEEDASAFINAEDSDNVKDHESYYLSIATLVSGVRDHARKQLAIK